MIEAWARARVRIVGSGAIGAGLAAALPGAVVYSRAPRTAGVRPLAALSADVAAGERGRAAPIVLCLASSERERIAAAVAKGAAEVPRVVVAQANVEELDRDLPWAVLARSPVLVVTNPVELVCELVARRTGRKDVLGFGMVSDRERVIEALERGFGVGDPGHELEMTGLHGGRAIPLLSRFPWIMSKLAHAGPAEVAEGLGAAAGKFDTRPGRAAMVFLKLALAWKAPAEPEERAHALLHLAVRAITAAEFDGPRPPVARPVRALARQLEAWVAGRADAVAGLRAVSGAVAHPDGRAFVGGVQGAAKFSVPKTGPLERAMLGAEVQLWRAQVRELIGEAP